MLSIIVLFSLLATPIYAQEITYPGAISSYNIPNDVNLPVVNQNIAENVESSGSMTTAQMQNNMPGSDVESMGMMTQNLDAASQSMSEASQAMNMASTARGQSVIMAETSNSPVMAASSSARGEMMNMASSAKAQTMNMASSAQAAALNVDNDSMSSMQPNMASTGVATVYDDQLMDGEDESGESFFSNPFEALIDALSPAVDSSSSSSSSTGHHGSSHSGSSGHHDSSHSGSSGHHDSSHSGSSGHHDSTHSSSSGHHDSSHSSSSGHHSSINGTTGAIRPLPRTVPNSGASNTTIDSLEPMIDPTQQALLFSTCSNINPAFATVNWYTNATNPEMSILSYNICHVPSMQKKYLAAFRLQNYPNQYGSTPGAASAVLCGPLSESKVDCMSRIKFPNQCLVGRVNLPMAYDPNATNAVLTLISNPPATSLARLCL